MTRLLWLSLLPCSSGAWALAAMPAHAAPGAVYRQLDSAPQLIYQKGVPHTDRRGRLQFELNPASFLPLCAYETLPDMLPELKRAGFNCFKPWNGRTLAQVLPEAHGAGMQVIKEMLIAPCDFAADRNCDPESHAAPQIASYVSQVGAAADDPAILAWVIEEEPTACINPPHNCVERFTNYRDFMTALKAVDPVNPSFDLDLSLPYASALTPWREFNGIGDIESNDNYPFRTGREKTLSASADDYSRLVVLARQTKPVWITVQAFEQPPGAGMSWKMPTPQQLRAEVFAAIVQGATGIIYFAVDSWASRNAHVIGIAAAPVATYVHHAAADVVASPTEIAASAALWNETVRLNTELQRLREVILSPTAALPYQVAVQGAAISAVPIRSLLKRSPNGALTLLAVNLDQAPLRVQFTLPRPPSELYAVDADGARQPARPDGNGFTVPIEGFGVRIYEFR